MLVSFSGLDVDDTGKPDVDFDRVSDSPPAQTRTSDAPRSVPPSMARTASVRPPRRSPPFPTVLAIAALAILALAIGVTYALLHR